MEIRRLSDDDYEAFLREKEYAVVLFDAPWDVGGGASIRPRFERAASEFAGRVGFGEVDCDEHVRMARSVPIVNVPTMGYYRGGRLVAALIGGSQDVIARTGALMAGETIGRKDGRDMDVEGKALATTTRERPRSFVVRELLKVPWPLSALFLRGRKS